MIASLYNRYVVPRLINFCCAARPVLSQRASLIPDAEGVVLEVGIGSGLNVPYYDVSKVRHVIGVDPCAEVRALGRDRFAETRVPVELVHGSGEMLPVEERSIDTVVLTYTLCSIANAPAAASEMRRVLKPGGRLLVCEHGRSRDARVAWWQDRVNPLWSRLAGGCNVNRDAAEILSGAGFRFDHLETFYLEGTPRFAGFHYRGVARPV